MQIAGKFKDAMSKIRTGFDRGTSQSIEHGKGSIFSSPQDYVQELKNNVPEGVGYAGGRIAGDFATDASRAAWWLINNSEAVARLGTGKIAKMAETVDPRTTTLIGSVLGGTLATTSGTFDIGNIPDVGRKAGYEAIYYDKDNEDADRTKTVDPLREFGSRYVLGYRGGILPKWDYLDERPDVTPQEYDDLMKYRRQKGILKGTWKGDTGTPTATFLGYDMPIESIAATALTGLALGKYLKAKKNYGTRVAGTSPVNSSVIAHSLNN